MSTSRQREILEAGVMDAALMQVATLAESGFPAVCNVWFRVIFRPDRLYFISRTDRNHSVNIRNDSRVAAGITLEVPGGLGGRVRGVTLTGNARQVPRDVFPEIAEDFIARWPRAVEALTPVTADPESTPSRLYEIAVVDWVLFDEVNFPEQPRISVAAL
jgi:hypothetical protein